MARMKTTVDLPDELLRAVKIRAAAEGRRLREVMADLIRLGLEQETRGAQGRSGERTEARVRLPLVRCAHPAAPGEELTPERVAALLAADEARAALDHE